VPAIAVRLSDCRLVVIEEAKWPVIAWRSYHDEQVEYQITVREHADGHRLIYGTFTSKSADEPDRYAGSVLSCRDARMETALHVRRVEGEIDSDRYRLAAAVTEDIYDIEHGPEAPETEKKT